MKNFWTYFLLLLIATQATAQDLVVETDKPTVAVSPAMWGVFFEDINFGADGGLYAELVKNRSFEFTRPMMGWKEVKAGDSRFLVNNRPNNSANPRYITLTINSSDSWYGLQNEGFRGMGVKAGSTYNFSAMLNPRQSTGLEAMVKLLSSKGEVLGESKMALTKTGWQTVKASITSSATDPKAVLQLLFKGKGKVEADMISLFPTDTWKGRTNGLRKDLVQKLADLKPGFIRFPGGCIVEGFDLTSRYQWKTTVGLPESRKTIINRWNTEFAAKLTPDYFQSFGLGFFEYFQLCEDLGSAPLPILNCGMACQFNSSEVVEMPQLDPYVQDALDLIEFANGAVTTKWGAVRAKMGHPAPFNLTMMGVGNEQWGPQYIERFAVFQSAIKKRYPAMKLIGAAGPGEKGQVDYLSKELRRLNNEFIDEHFYVKPEVFEEMATRYDTYQRGTSKIFVGEYAAHGSEGKDPLSKNTWMSALSEAAFMTGLERNADVVGMSSYAPLFANVEAWQWRPDLIWFDNLTSVATPNYYVQQFFSAYHGDAVVPFTAAGKIIAGADKLFGSATVQKASGKVYVKLVNASGNSKDVTIDFRGAKSNKASWQELQTAEPDSFNSMQQPNAIKPVQKTVSLTGGKASLMLQPLSVNLITLE